MHLNSIWPVCLVNANTKAKNGTMQVPAVHVYTLGRKDFRSFFLPCDKAIHTCSPLDVTTADIVFNRYYNPTKLIMHGGACCSMVSKDVGRAHSLLMIMTSLHEVVVAYKVPPRMVSDLASEVTIHFLV